MRYYIEALRLMNLKEEDTKDIDLQNPIQYVGRSLNKRYLFIWICRISKAMAAFLLLFGIVALDLTFVYLVMNKTGMSF